MASPDLYLLFCIASLERKELGGSVFTVCLLGIIRCSFLPMFVSDLGREYFSDECPKLMGTLRPYLCDECPRLTGTLRLVFYIHI
jgi:hypothetical protein